MIELSFKKKSEKKKKMWILTREKRASQNGKIELNCEWNKSKTVHSRHLLSNYYNAPFKCFDTRKRNENVQTEKQDFLNNGKKWKVQKESKIHKTEYDMK